MITVDEKIWSSSDFPYQCLLDAKRTAAFQAAIRAVVRPGDVVLDAGAGSGILSFFAADAGASKVYAAEIDPTLASHLRRSIVANGKADVVSVVDGSVHNATLPSHVDVFICEMMDTGLMDEMQVTAINSLRAKDVLTSKTRLIPYQYETFVQFGYTSFTYYGYQLLLPKHEWRHYASGHEGWLATQFHPVMTPVSVGRTDFTRPIEPRVQATFTVEATSSGLVNAIRISAEAHLAPGMILGATNALNGDKILALTEETRVVAGHAYRAEVRYVMGGGLGSLVATLRER